MRARRKWQTHLPESKAPSRQKTPLNVLYGRGRMFSGREHDRLIALAAMKRIMSWSKLLETLGSNSRRVEIYALGEAMFDEEKSQLVVELDTALRGPGSLRPPPSKRVAMPPKEVVRESLPLSDADGAARDIFERWTQKVRRSIETALNPKE